MPPRAQLWLPSLPPDDGLRRESLISLSRRTAEANQIPVSRFITAVLLPDRNWKGGSISQLQNHIHRINGDSVISVQWGESLARLACGLDHMKYTTRGVATGDFPALVCSRVRKWCPECYEADVRRPWGPYERLLWSVEAVKICVIHRRLLHTMCPHCHSGPFQIMEHKDESGCCPDCGIWLGVETPVLGAAKETYLMDEWCARALAYLINEPPAGGPVQVARNVSSLLRALAQHHGVNGKRLGQIVQRPEGTVSAWLHGLYRPNVGGLLAISYAFHVPLQDLLLGQLGAVATSTIRTVPKALGARTEGKPAVRLSMDALEQLMASLRAGHHPHLISLIGAARFLDVSWKSLRKKAPPVVYRELSNIILKQKSQWISRRRAVRELSIQRAIEEMAVAAAQQGVAVTRRNVGRELADRGLPRRGPEEWELYKRAREIHARYTAHKVSGNS